MPIPKKEVQINKQSAKDLVFETVQKWIISGVLQPGEKIIDSELAVYFDVSRTPVREALQLLGDQNFVEIYPSKGTIVKIFKDEEIKQTYELMSELQASAIHLAYPHITDKDLDELAILNEDFKKAIDGNDAEDIKEKDRLFHQYIIDTANNEYLSEQISNLLVRTSWLENMYFSSNTRNDQSIEQHNQIIEALKQKDIVLAENKMRENWLSSYEILKTTIK